MKNKEEKKGMRYIYGILVLVLVGCGGSGENVKKATDIDLSDTHVYQQDSKYSKVLKRCATAHIRSASCALATLPLLSQIQSIPTKEQIMQRVLVSHDWMGERFSQMLDILGDDIKELLGAVTAIVIDDDVRPSHYWTMTGAIYLDPRYLWLTPSEAHDITVKDDYRKNYGSELKFDAFWRYVKDNQYAYHFSALDSNTTRATDDIKYPLARLLYHELAHANDFAPREVIASFNQSTPIVTLLNTNSIKNKYPSTQLYKTYPLESNTLKSIGKVLYHGTTSNNEEKGLSSKDIGLLFAEDGASAMYGYSTQYEDMAMMFEMTMMKYHYNIEADIGFVTNPSEDHNITYKDYIVGWGIRNRIADPLVSERALFIAKKILPNETNWDNYFASEIGESKMLKEGLNWFDNLNLGVEKRQIENRKIDSHNFERFE